MKPACTLHTHQSHFFSTGSPYLALKESLCFNKVQDTMQLRNYFFKEGLTPAKPQECLDGVFRGSSSSYSTLKEWAKLFKFVIPIAVISETIQLVKAEFKSN